MGLLDRIGNLFKSDVQRPQDIRLGRNDPCWCGSGKKYKKCHLEADEKIRRKHYTVNCGPT